MGVRSVLKSLTLRTALSSRNVRVVVSRDTAGHSPYLSETYLVVVREALWRANSRLKMRKDSQRRVGLWIEANLITATVDMESDMHPFSMAEPPALQRPFMLVVVGL